MIFRILIFLAVLIVPCWAQKQESEVLSPREIQQQREQGQRLARQLRSATPTENIESSGVLKIYCKDKKRNVPVTWKVELQDAKWKTIYQTAATPDAGAELLIIVHDPNGPNEYSYAKAPTPTAALPVPKVLNAKEILQPFAGSDFSIADLGMEFLFWPEQRRLPSGPGDLRLGQVCYILESSDPTAPEIVRIKSYIDQKTFDQTESVGLLVATAYDSKHREVKEFSVGGTNFKKIKGQWYVEKITMYTQKTKSETVLKFDLPKE